MEPERKSFNSSLDSFSRKLYNQLVNLNPTQNLICSPLSIQTCVGMLRMGAEDDSDTAKELDEGLCFSSNKATEIANSFNNVLAAYKQYSVVKMANKMYLMKNYEALKEFHDTLTEKFHSEAERIDFSANNEAAATINEWVESRTNNLITNLISPNMLDQNTRLVLINAIHFKGEWIDKFDENETRIEDFHLENESRVRVSMMNASNKYYYANLPELDAKVLRLPYRNTNLFMLFVLPNIYTGLKQLEKKLQTVTLDDITRKLVSRKVFVKLPKFKTEYSQELTPIFKELNIKKIFNSQAELPKMLVVNESIEVSHIIHKAFIEVNEEGTEAAAATGAVMVLRSLPAHDPEPQTFHADHPFFYTIYDLNHGCLFMGKLGLPEGTVITDNKKMD
ncbi:alaserpin-like [Drosophila nasuta]|uniref:alaserpin-like n=1 Tax=Drosophila nasuta TaxID=42062 RepID=UPI00295E3E70|nr:alaserpin-like [Drosophila nasuta]